MLVRRAFVEYPVERSTGNNRAHAVLGPWAAPAWRGASIFPELGAASLSTRRKRPAKYRDPQIPDQTWSGIGRTPKWVHAILDEPGIDLAAFKSIPMYQIHASS